MLNEKLFEVISHEGVFLFEFKSSMQMQMILIENV